MTRAAGPDESSSRLLTLLGGRQDSDETPAHLLGLEQEYSLSAHGLQVDFRGLIHRLPVAGERLDPGDRNAYRCPSGISLTCDDAEAEVALPPVYLNPGFSNELDAWSMTARSQLETLLPRGIDIAGYSTHVSAAMPQHLNEPASQLYAKTFAPSLMLLADRPSGFGVYLRPRPGRLEFCSDQLEGARLRAVATFIAGSVRATAATLTTARIESMPPPVEVTWAPTKQRYGLYLSRRAFGDDLYTSGRDARLSMANGGTISAQEHLELSWSAAWSALSTCAQPEELRLVDDLVFGRSPLPVESDEPLRADSYGIPLPTPFGGLTGTRLRPGFSVSATLVTWDFSVFEIAGGDRKTYACVPRPYLSRFLKELDNGRLDTLFSDQLRRPPAGRVLELRAQTKRPGLWDRIDRPQTLLPPERNVNGSPTPQHSSDNGRSGKGPVTPLAAVPPVRHYGEREPAKLNGWMVAVMVYLAVVSILLGKIVSDRLGGDDNQNVAAVVVTPTATRGPAGTVSPVASGTAVAVLPGAGTPGAGTPGAGTLTPAAGTGTPGATGTPAGTPTVAPSPTLVAVVPTQPPAPTATSAPPTPVPPTATSAPPTATSVPPTATPVPNLVANVGPIGAVANGDTTSYVLLNGGGSLSYAWAGPACGETIGAASSGFSWNHAAPGCASNPTGTTVQVIVTDGTNKVLCTYTGTANGVGSACRPF